MYRHVLVAIDGSLTSDLALREAFKFASAGAKLTAVTVVDNPLVNVGYDTTKFMTFDYDQAHEEFLQEAKLILENAAYDADRLAGVKIETQLVDMGIKSDRREISTAIERAAAACDADLIVMGTHGRRGFQRFMLGSVAEHVIRNVHIPVLLIRDQTDDRPK